MRIYCGADHRGFELKQQLIEWLRTEGHEVEDCGNTTYEPEDDYVDFAKKVAAAVQSTLQHPSPTLQSVGILICGSGIGVSVVANRYKGVVCALGFDPAQVKHGRENDHINCLSIPSDYVDFEKAKQLIQALLKTEPQVEEKYLRRIQKIDG